MPVIQREVSIPAGGLNENLLAGSAFEFARQAQVVSIGLTQAATGMFGTIQSGGDIVAEEFSPAVLTRFPIIPDEMYYNDVMAVGDRLVVRVRNPTAGAVIARCLVQIQPLG
jgi:hypothetical protein